MRNYSVLTDSVQNQLKRGDLRIHYLQHVPFEGLGNIENRALSNGHPITYMRLFKQYPQAANRHNIHSALRDRRIPIHPQGTIKAPASPHTTRAGGAEREGAPGQSGTIWVGRRVYEWRGELHINDLLDFYLRLLFPAAKKIQHPFTPNHPHNPITPKSSASDSTIAITENAKITR